MWCLFTLGFWIHCLSVKVNICFSKNKVSPLFVYPAIFTRESSYSFEPVLAIAVLFVCLSIRLSVRPSVCHTCGSVKSGASQNHQIFTVGCLEDSNFRNRKAFPLIRRGSPRMWALNERGVGIICDFWPISHCISVTVQDSA